MAIETTPTILEDLTKLGGVYGLFFIVQAYGYAFGRNQSAPTSIHEAVVEGFRHLSNSLMPWKKLASPLAPILCSFLLLYAIYLPFMFSGNASPIYSPIANRLFSSLLFGTSLTTISGFISSESKIISFYAKGHSTTIRSLFAILIYSSIIVSWSGLGYFIFGLITKLPAAVNFTKQPWSEMISAIIVAWLYFLTYIGSVFDGRLDRALEIK